MGTKPGLPFPSEAGRLFAVVGCLGRDTFSCKGSKESSLNKEGYVSRQLRDCSVQYCTGQSEHWLRKYLAPLACVLPHSCHVGDPASATIMSTFNVGRKEMERTWECQL